MIVSCYDCGVFLLYFLVISVTGTKDREHRERKFKAVPLITLHKSYETESHPLPADVTAKIPTTNTLTVTDSKLTTSAIGISTSGTFVANWTTATTLSSGSTSNTSLPTSPTQGPTFHPITAPPVNDTCQCMLEQYGKLASNFTNCAIVHAKPSLFCENCVLEYVGTLEAYDTITNDEDHKCKDTLLSSDRVQVVNQLHNFVKNLWDDGNCDSCFAEVKACHVNKTCSLSPETKKFMDAYQDTMKCFAQFHGKNASLEISLPSVCGNCSSSYQNLNEKYEDTGPLDDTCMDVVELMNHTRIKWSREFHCIQFKKDVGSVIALGCFVGTLPLFFFCAVRVHAVKQERRYMRQKRLSCAQSTIQYSSSS